MSGENKTTITLSVRDLVEFSARRGDLFFESASGPTHIEGIAGHRRLQKSRGEDWQAEYPLKQTLKAGNYQVTLQGRADLINPVSSPVIIEEIKTSYFPPERLAAEKLDLYRAQAKLYAWLYHLSGKSETKSYSVHVSLFNLLDGKVYTEKTTVGIEELEQFAFSLLDIYLHWYDLVSRHRKKRTSSAQKLDFPYPAYRPGQHRLARHIYRTIQNKQQLLVQAPTGTGKTVSAFFPAIKAMGEGLIEQVVYLTAKTPAQRNAETTIGLLREKGLQIDFLILSARDKTCPCRSPDKNDSSGLFNEEGRCCRTIGFYDRLPEARSDALNASSLSAATLREIAEAHRVCPFALALHLLPWMSVVVCDFNYFFDPLTKLNAFENHAAKRALLIDEVHNLPDRARDMYSATLSTGLLADIRQHPGVTHPPVKTAVNRLSSKLSAVAKTDQVIDELPPDLVDSTAALIEALVAADESDSNIDIFDTTGNKHKDNLRELIRFYVIGQMASTSHKTLISINGDGKNRTASLTRLCLDAAPFLAESYKKTRAITGFSATLKPLEFYIQVLGLHRESYTYTLPPAFPSQNLCVLRSDYIDTRWQFREQSRPALIDLIAAVYRVRTGKYLVFFPSYEYMNQVYDSFCQAHPDISVIRQAAGSNEEERKNFLNFFFDSDQPALGFAILGGIFAEGIDYVADALHGAIIVGTGMPQPTRERKLMQDYFAHRNLNGFLYAYQFPGLCRVLQTAGRVIRSENDRGIVVLVDPRYKRPDYRQLMPGEWNPIGCGSLPDVENALRNFWQVI